MSAEFIDADDVADMAATKQAIMEAAESVTFKLKDGSTIAGPYPCFVRPHLQQAGSEKTEGDRTTAFTRWDIVVPAQTLVKEFWRAVVTFSTGEVANYFVESVVGPMTWEDERVCICTKVA